MTVEDFIRPSADEEEIRVPIQTPEEQVVEKSEFIPFENIKTTLHEMN